MSFCNDYISANSRYIYLAARSRMSRITAAAVRYLYNRWILVHLDMGWALLAFIQHLESSERMKGRRCTRERREIVAPRRPKPR
jgi:hypothetical protein